MSDEIWGDLSMAEQAVASRDYKHALHHLAPVLLEEPESADALRLLVRIAAESPDDPLTLLDLKDEVYAGTVAVAALLCARSGRSDLAITHALQVVQAVPHARLLVWLQKWSRDQAFVRAMSLDAAADAFLAFAFNLAQSGADEIEERLTEVLDAVENFRLHAPEHQRLAYAHSLILRRLGRFDEAVAAAAEVLENGTDLESVVGLATAYREAGRPEDALAAFERASRIDPDNEAVWLDVGDVRLDLQMLEEALDAYERALELEPGQPWAVASIAYTRFHLSYDAEHLDVLDDLAFAGNERALTLAVAASPYLGYLPHPAEATINLLAKLQTSIPNVAPGDAFRFTLSSMEAPSSRLVFDRWAEGKGFGRPEVTIQEVPQPDPRLPWGDVEFVLWRYDDVHPSPAVRTPRSAELAEHVASIAATPFHAYRWFEMAQALALPANAIDDLLASMLHPPETPRKWTPWEWLQRAQFAAAMLIAASEPDVAWPESRRRKTLYALIHGPIDWTTSAAIGAVTAASAAGAADAREGAAWLQALWSHAPASGYWTVQAPLTFALLRYPEVDASTREVLRQTRAEILFDLFGGEATEAPPPRPRAKKKQGFWRRLFGR